MKAHTNSSTISEGEQAGIRKLYINDLEPLPVLCHRPPIPYRRAFPGSSAIFNIQKSLTKSAFQTFGSCIFLGRHYVLYYCAPWQQVDGIAKQSLAMLCCSQSFAPGQYSRAYVPEGTTYI